MPKLDESCMNETPTEPRTEEKWYVAVINGKFTLVALGTYVGRGRYAIRKQFGSNVLDYRLIDSSDIVCRATPENSGRIVDALVHRRLVSSQLVQGGICSGVRWLVTLLA
jgi:hypothetical protein